MGLSGWIQDHFVSKKAFEVGFCISIRFVFDPCNSCGSAALFEEKLCFSDDRLKLVAALPLFKANVQELM